MFHISLLVLFAVNSKAKWLIDKFVEVENDENSLRHVELRWPCCVPYDDFVEEFSSSQTLVGSTREELLNDFKKAEKENENCKKLCEDKSYVPSTPLETFEMEVNEEIHELEIFTGDMLNLEARVLKLCHLLNVEGEDCNELFNKTSFETKNAILAEVHSIRETDRGSEKAHELLLEVINGLNDQVRNIQEESELKSQAFGDLKTKNRQTSHEMYRKLIQLNGAQGTLPQEPTSSVSHLAKIIEYFQASEKFAEYAATLSEIYNDRFGDKGEQCSSDGTCKSEILPTKLPMLRVNYDTMTYNDYVDLLNLNVPFIFTGARQVEGRPGVPNWTFEGIKEVCGDHTVTLKYKNASFDSHWGGIQDVTEESLFDFMEQVQDPSITKGWPDSLKDLYLHDWSVATNCPDYLKDFFLPKYFSTDHLEHTTQKNDGWPSVFIGSKGTASGLHADWAATPGWMGLLKGRKHWAIGTPMDRPLYYENSLENNQFDGNIFKPDFEKYPAQRFTVYFDDILEEGEIIFIPPGNPHQIENLELTIATAANYVDKVVVNMYLHQIKNAFQMESSGMEFLEHKIHREEIKALASKESVDDRERSISYEEFTA